MKKFKKALAVMLSVIMVLGVMPATIFTASAESTCPIDGATGTGTQADPIVVDTFEELNAALTYSEELYVQVDTDIECPESIMVKGSKTLTVNGKLYSNTTILYGPGSSDALTIQGTGSIVSDYICINALGYVTLKGDVTYESTGGNTVFSNTSDLRIEGGIFKASENYYGLHLNKNKAVFAGGSFPGGISWVDGGTYELENGYKFSYEDGSISGVLKPDVPVDVVFVAEYDIGFATQTPAMPGGETVTHLGDFTVGAEEAQITFGFTANSLPDEMIQNGFSLTEKLSVFSYKNGLLLEQDSGATYTIDNTVVDSYTVFETIILKDSNGVISDTLRHVFTISIHPEGYVADTDCPIEVATGAGTESDPVIVDTYAELKAALEYTNKLYIQVDGYIECLETIEVNRFTKVLTVNGTLHCENSVLSMGTDNYLTLQGNGKIISDSGACLLLSKNNIITIKGNLTFETNGINVIESNDSFIGGGILTIDGGTFKSNDINGCSIYNDATLYLDIVLSGGYFSNGINSNRIDVNLKEGGLYCYDDGTVSTTLKKNTPVEIYSIGFATQSPAMPEGQTTADFDDVFEHGKDSLFTFSFTLKPLPQVAIEAGYSITEEMTVYSENQGKVINTQSNGNAYTIEKTVVDTYTVTQTLKLKKDGEVIDTLTHTFSGDVKQSDLFGFENHTPAVSEEESLNGSKDLGTFIPYLFDGKFSFTPYISEALADKGYYLLNYNYLRKNGETVYTMTETQADVSSYITGAGDYEFWQEIHLYDSEDNYIDSVSFVYYFTIGDVDDTFDFISHTPELSTEDTIDGRTDLGVIFEAPSFSYTAKDIPDYLKAAGYELVFRTRVWYTDTAVMESEDPFSWTCGVYDYGTKTVRQSLMLYAPDGTLVSAKHHTYTFTYLPLKFASRTPSVTADEIAAGFTDLGTLTTAQKFSFSAVPLDYTLKEEGYSIALKTEAYQGDKLVYSADNGDSYIHIYQGEGRVVQTIYMLNGDGEVLGSISHAYTFVMEFPDGTITLDSDFISIEEGATQTISATIVPESLADTLVWTSSNPEIVTVSQDGTLTAVRAGSAFITATLGNGAVAYCTVMVTASDVSVYVGGVGLAVEEYLIEGSSIPTTTKPSDNYAYLAMVNGVLTLTLHNYSYSGAGTFISKNVAYGIYSAYEIKVIAEGKNKIGPLSAPIDRYTSYGIGKGETVSFSSDSASSLTIDGVSAGISSSGYVFISGNLNIINASGGISCTHAQSRGSISFNSGNVNIDCTGTAITITGNAINFAGANVNINCKNGINLVRQGTISVTDGSLVINAFANGINLKSGQSMTVDYGTVYIEAANNGIALEGDLTVNDGSMVVKSTDTESDSTYSALNGAGTVTLATAVSAIASTESSATSMVTFSSADMATYDYVLIEGTTQKFVKQPVGGTIGSIETMTVTWETGFIPVKIELATYDGTSLSYTTLDATATSAELGVLPENGYYQIRAYYTSSYYTASNRFYIDTAVREVAFYFGDSPIVVKEVKDGDVVSKIADPGIDGYFFLGWCTEDGILYDFSTPVTGDLNLYPGWTVVQLDGVPMAEGTYLAVGSDATTTEEPEGGHAFYSNGNLYLYNYSNDGSGIEFGNIDLTVYSLGDGNYINCIMSDGEEATLTIDGNAKLNIGHAQWMDSAIIVYDTITFRCDTEIECIDAMAIPDVLKVIVDNCDVRVYAYSDTSYPRTIYGCEAEIEIRGDGSLYLYADTDNDALTDSYIAEPDKVTVYANAGNDGSFTDEDMITQVSDAYDLMEYNQVLIKHKHITITHAEVSATCQTTGVSAYYECYCGKFFADSDCTSEITDLEEWKDSEGKLATVGHNWTNKDGKCAFGCDTVAFEAVNSAVIDTENRIIHGIDAGISSIDSYTNILVEGAEWSYDSSVLGTGTTATLKNGDKIIAEYTLLIYGDVNGDGWYDGMDAVIVSCLANGMLTKDDVGETVYTAADCNHDDVIDQLDVDLLNQAGTLLASVDQSKSSEELLETSSAYVEYLELIEQSPEIEIEDKTDVENSIFAFFSKFIAILEKLFNFISSFINV